MADGKKSKPGAGRKGSHPTPHDTLFRAVFSDPAHARALVRDHLPNDIAALLADKPPVILDRSFIDEDMRETRADLLLEVELDAGGTGFVHVLVEHKSRFDPEVVLQMAGYMISVRKDHVRRGKGRDGRAARARNLPPIIPLLGYSGARPWTGPTDLEGMMATDNPTLHFLRGPHLILRQWARMPPGALSRDPVPQAGLLALTGRAPAWLDEIEEALQDNPVLQDQFAVYIRDTVSGAALDELEEKLATARAGQTEGVMGAIMERLRAEGIAEGEARGRAEGEARGRAEGRSEGKADGLARLLTRRFGPLPDPIRARLAAASVAELDTWLDSLLDATSLEEVFRHRSPSPDT